MRKSSLTPQQQREREQWLKAHLEKIALANKNNQQIREAWKYEATKQR